MADGPLRQWALRPARHQMYTIGEINAGLISLMDIAEANEYLDIEQANQALARERMQK